MASITEQTTPNEDEVTKRHLKFMTFLMELAAKDPEWRENLKEKAEEFGRLEN